MVLQSSGMALADPGNGNLEFEVVDVFTRTAFEGNPLAVVLGGERLSVRQMQAVAVEFALSETVFPLAPDDAERARGVDYRLRIFTPTEELPFAGHPSIGTAWLMAQRGVVQPGRVVQACGAGDLPLEVAPGGGEVTLTGGTPTLGPEVDRDEVAAAMRLAPDDLVDPAPRIAGTGLPYCYVRVGEGALARVDPDLRSLAAIGSVYVFAWNGLDDVRARMFGPDIGVAEDPATGSAALGLGVHAVTSALLPRDGVSTFVVRQGAEMGRPSELRVAVEARDGAAVSARVAGDVARVSLGRIAIPAR